MCHLKPTPEQQAAIDAHAQGGDIKLVAFAGTGKSTTLNMIAHSTNRCGHYLAFNRDIVNETAGLFPENVQCRTIHSVAFRVMVRHYSVTKMTSRLLPWQASDYFDIQSIDVLTSRGSVINLSTDMVAGIALEIIRKYCHSNFNELSKKCIPSIGYFKQGVLSQASIHDLIEKSLALAKTMWEKMTDPNDCCPLGHDGYLKLFALSKPELGKQFILIDECQDSNGVTLSLLWTQKKRGTQLTFVGDPYQSIYEWRGAKNIMDDIDARHHLYLTESFRFGEQIADAASRMLVIMGENKTITGRGERDNVVIEKPCRTVLCRSNAGVLQETLRKMEKGKKVSVAGGIVELENEVKDAGYLKKENRPVKRLDSILYGLPTWKDALGAIENKDDSAPIDHGLKVLVKCVEKYGHQKILRGLKKTVDEKQADIIISTVHKAKGRQWPEVMLSTDFKEEIEGHAEEDRLLYVAMTRARRVLSLTRPIAQRLGFS